MLHRLPRPNTKWDSAAGRAQPIGLAPIGRGPLSARNIFTMGSCFALEVRLRLRELGHSVYPRYTDIAFDPQTAMVSKLPADDDMNHYSIASIRQELENALSAKPLINEQTFFDLTEDDGVAKQIRLFLRSVRRTIRGRPAPTFTAKWQDPYRKHVLAEDRATLSEISRAITARVRDGVLQSDIFIITLGMTELWRDRRSGLVVCNSYGARVDEVRCDFHDLSYSETKDEIVRVVDTIRKPRPEADIVFTVSPVPLQRTARDQSVVIANAASKAKQRAAVDEVVRQFKNVFYFPSFEMVLADPSSFEADGRHVRPEKVGEIVQQFVQWHEG